jgi:peptidyl-prolyl cis-trans isomerase C
MLKPTNIAALAIFAAIAANTVNAVENNATSNVAAATATAADANVTITVNKTPIPQARIDLRLKVAAQQGQPDSPDLRKAIRDDLINLEVISQEAAKKGLDKQPEVVQQIELTRQTALANAYVMDYVKSHPISEDALKQEYENQKVHYGNKEYKVEHILVDTEKEAQAIIVELKKKGSKFDKIAKKSSKDPGSKDKGGDLGWTVPSTFVQPFGEAILKLTKGELSAPVQTQYGWHVIKLDDIRDLKIPAIEEVKGNLEKRLQQQSIQDAIKALRANAEIKQ